MSCKRANHADTLRLLEEEKNRRVYYQDIVYAVCNSLDRIFAKNKSNLVVCGTKDKPSRQVQELLRELEAALHDYRWELAQSQSDLAAARDGIRLALSRLTWPPGREILDADVDDWIEAARGWRENEAGVCNCLPEPGWPHASNCPARGKP